jgi:hypothetical protein
MVERRAEEQTVSIQIRDEPTAAVLARTTDPQDVRGPDGKLIGRFIPVTKLTVSYPELEITDEELLQQVNDPNAIWHTPEEVMARLREIDQCSR